MAYQLEFSTRLLITLDEIGLLVPIAISKAVKHRQLDAYFDSGSSYCVFPRWLGEDLGLAVESGEPVGLRTGGGVMQTYLHYATLHLAELTFEDVPICIAKYPDFDRCLLGRGGWLQKVRLCLVTYHDQLFLSLHDE